MDLRFKGVDGSDFTVGDVEMVAQMFLDDRGSLLARHFGSDGMALNDHLLFLVVDTLRVANWQRSKDGQDGRNMPEPISPLAVQAAEEKAAEQQKLIKTNGERIAKLMAVGSFGGGADVEH